MTFLVWALVGGSAGVLALRLWPAPTAPMVPLAAGERLAAPSLERLLGAPEAAPAVAQPAAAPADARFQLLGLVAARQADRQGREGLALIAVDGGTPRSVRVGQAVDGDLQLLRVEPTGVALGRQGAVQVQLRLDPPAAAATGSLPSLSMAPAAPQGFAAVGQPMPMPIPMPQAHLQVAPQEAPAQAQMAATPVSGPLPPPGDALPRRRNPMETLR